MRFQNWPAWMQIWITLALIAGIVWIGLFVLAGVEASFGRGGT